MISTQLLVLTFSVFLLGLGLTLFATDSSSVLDRVQRGTCRRRSDEYGAFLSSAGGRAKSFLGWLGGRLVRGGETSRLGIKLAAAGCRGRDCMAAYRGVQSLCVGLPMFLWPVLDGDPSTKWLFTVALVVTSGLLPGQVVARLARKRKEAAEMEFPSFMQLLVLSVSSGTGFDQSLRGVVNDGRELCPVISAEMQMALDEMESGAAREKCLADVGTRLDSQDIDRLSRIVVQADKSGGGLVRPIMELAKAAEETREFRTQARIEKLPVKMIPVVGIFIFLPCLAVIVGPIFVQFVKTVGKM